MLRVQTLLILFIHLITKLIGFMTLLPGMLGIFVCRTDLSCWKPNSDGWRWIAIAISGIIVLVPYGRIKNRKTLRIYFIILTFVTLSGILSGLPDILAGKSAGGYFPWGPAVLIANIYLCYRHYQHLLYTS